MPDSNNANSNNANSNNARGSVPFEKILEYLLNGSSGTTILERCINPTNRDVSKIPLRYRIIALAFIERYNLNQLNAMLDEHRCERLYAKSLWEATLIYAFSRGLSFEAWKELESRCAVYRDQIVPHDIDLSDGKTTMKELRKYVEDNSDMLQGRRVTRHMTRVMQESISTSDEKVLQEWLDDSIDYFSTAREKTRYYFCKYLLYYLEAIVEQYITAVKTGRGLEDALDKVSVFKITSVLKRKDLSEKELREKFEDAAISSRELFEAFNYFYFGYVSVDWLEALAEYYGDFEDIPQAMKDRFCDSARRYYPALRNKSCDEIIVWAKEILRERDRKSDEDYSINNPGKGYQKNRSGENAVRRYLHGDLDLDRTNLICYLIFFGLSCKLPPDQKITVERLNTILRECGYTALDPSDEFDNFVIRFLNSDNPVETLMNEVSQFAQDGRNFYLYRLYRLSNSADDIWVWLMNEL